MFPKSNLLESFYEKHLKYAQISYIFQRRKPSASLSTPKGRASSATPVVTQRPHYQGKHWLNTNLKTFLKTLDIWSCLRHLTSSPLTMFICFLAPHGRGRELTRSRHLSIPAAPEPLDPYVHVCRTAQKSLG